MKRLFVGNVEFSLSKTQLRTLFERHGSVASVSLVTARDTGQACACGFVEMSDDSEAEGAMAALNGTYAGGRPLIVNEARPKNRAA
jgi:RNA recognition motif-containing protein